MRQEDSLTEFRRRVVEEMRIALARDDRWLLIHLTRKDGGKIALGSDTLFQGFQDSRELRGPRWRTLASAQEFAEIGYSGVVAGELTASLLFRQLLAGKVPKGVVMHVDAVHRWAPKCAEITATVNSVHGFLNSEAAENRSRAAKRPGRVARARLTSGGCHLCGSKLELTLHHLIPREMGGATEEENLLSVCRPCHDAIHRNELDVTELMMQVSVKRVVQLLQSSSDDTRSGGGAGDV